VQAELEQLLVLQDRDQKIRQLQAELKTIPQQSKSLDVQLAASAAGIEALKLKARHAEVDRKKLELDIATRRESIARLKTQQYQTRKNDEFQAMGHEIERYEKEISAIEDQELEIMEQGDQLKSRFAEEEKHGAVAKESIGRQVADLAAKTKALEGRLAELQKERVALVSGMDEDVLSRFERLFASKGDAAVVALEHEVCTGCHMKVTTQTAVRVKGGKEVVSCEQCGRILYAA
jgi:predicted  nucleic acid-binding Zn-ribbon protein